jgi:hypothetical protein
MIKISLTDEQFDYFINGINFENKAIKFLKFVYVDRVSIKKSSSIAGFSCVRGYQLSGQFTKIIDNKLKENGKKFTIKIQ